MNIQTKYDIGFPVFLIWENEIKIAHVESIHYTLYSDKSGGLKYKLKEVYNDISTSDFTFLDHPEIPESKLFQTKEALLQSL